MDRETALARLRDGFVPVAPDQTFVVDRFRPEDGPGLARLFFAIYGESYPITDYYDPSALSAANADGRLHSVVARTPSGDVVGHGALYRSGPPNPKLLELGLGLVLPDYRQSFATFRINQLLFDQVAPALALDGVFGEAVCHIVATQKISRIFGLSPVAIELDLMPEGSYAKEGSPGRVSTLFVFRPFGTPEQPLFLPPAYREELELALSDLGLPRSLAPAEAAFPAGTATRLAVEVFPWAGVLRANVASAGADLARAVDAIERRADDEGLAVRQAYLSLAEPQAGAATEAFRERGYVLGGLVPTWFGGDALLLQRLVRPPDLSSIRLHAEKARTLLSFVERDLARREPAR